MNDYLLGLVTEPEAEPPVVPEVTELLEVPALPPVLLLGLALEPVEEPMPEVEPEVVPLALGEVLLPFAELPEPPDVPPEDMLEPDGLTEPVAAPEPDPIPEAEPEAVPLALGPEPAHAARVKAQAIGKIHLVIVTPCGC